MRSALSIVAGLLAASDPSRGHVASAGEWGDQSAGAIHAGDDPQMYDPSLYYADSAGEYMVGTDEAGGIVGAPFAFRNLAARPMAPTMRPRLMVPGATPQHPMFTAPLSGGSFVQYKPFEPTSPRKLPLGGFRVTVFAVNPVVNITNQPQIPFRTERIVVPSNIGVDFDISDVKVGNTSQFVASGNVPGLTFSEQGFDVALKGDTAYIAQAITIQVQNLSGVDKSFACCVIGIAVRGN